VISNHASSSLACSRYNEGEMLGDAGKYSREVQLRRRYGRSGGRRSLTQRTVYGKRWGSPVLNGVEERTGRTRRSVVGAGRGGGLLAGRTRCPGRLREECRGASRRSRRVWSAGRTVCWTWYESQVQRELSDRSIGRRWRRPTRMRTQRASLERSLGEDRKRGRWVGRVRQSRRLPGMDDLSGRRGVVSVRVSTRMYAIWVECWIRRGTRRHGRMRDDGGDEQTKTR
jgi:hypothetical protein